MYDKKYKEYEKEPEGHVKGSKDSKYVLPKDTTNYVHAEITPKGVSASVSEKVEGDKVTSKSNKKPYISLFEPGQFDKNFDSDHFNTHYHSVKVLHRPK